MQTAICVQSSLFRTTARHRHDWTKSLIARYNRDRGDISTALEFEGLQDIVESSPANPTDGELIAAVLAGDDNQFARLVSRYESPLMRVALSRLGNIERAEDVVQETFFNAHRWLKTYDSRYSFRTWLWTILLRQCGRNHARHTRTPHVHSWSNRPASDESSSNTPQPYSVLPSPPSQLLAKERTELLERSLKELPEYEADALRLRFYGQLKFQEIADTMACAISTAKNRVRNGLVKLAEIVTESEALAESNEDDNTKR